MIRNMKVHLVSKTCLIFLLSIISIFGNGKIALAKTVSENSGKFMLVKTPDESKSKDFLLVEKQNGRKSLVKIEKQTKKIERTLKHIGTLQLSPTKYYSSFFLGK